MSVDELSLEAYDSLDIETRQGMVYDYIREHPNVTSEQVMLGMGFKSPNAVAPRITELYQMGAIIRTGRGKTSSGRTAHTYTAVDNYGEED